MSKNLRNRPVPQDLHAAFGVPRTSAPEPTADLFPAPVASVPVVPSTTRQTLTTQELQLAVALIVNGYGDPTITKIGKTQGNKAKVEFAFTLPEGKTAKNVEADFWSKKMNGEIQTIFSTTRALKKRIDRLSDLSD